MDLQGGDYTVSRPLQIPPCYGNARIVGGSIRASKSFPSNKYIIIIGNDTTARPAAYPSYSALSRFASPDPPSCKNDGQGVYMQDVQLLGLLLDGQHVAAGGVLISYIMGALIGAQSYFVGFPKAGITVIAGHEVVIDAVWVAEYYWDSPLYDSSTSTGIEIFGNDHIIQNAIVFSANIGVHIIGAANLVYGAHTWSARLRHCCSALAAVCGLLLLPLWSTHPRRLLLRVCAADRNKGDESGGVGIFMDCAGYTQNRVIASYLDGNHLIAVSPEHLVVNECFFLGSAAVVLQSTANAGNNAINGLTILSNEWDGGDSSGRGVVIVDESRGAFTSLTDSFIDQNEIGGGYGTASTSARLHVSGSFSPGVPACWNLSQQLLFPQFPPAHVQATFSLSQRQEVAASDDGISWWLSQVGAGKGQDQRVVCIQVSMGGSSLDGEFYLEVDQSTRTGQDAQRIPYSAPAARTEREGQQEARKVSQPVRWF